MIQTTGKQAFSIKAWRAVKRLGREVDDRLEREGIGLTLGGEPTFVAVDHPDLPEWRTEPLGHDKRRRARRLLLRLRRAWIPDAPLQFAVGKIYPGEDQPRWSFGCYWRRDGRPLWSDPSLLSSVLDPAPATHPKTTTFLRELAKQLNIDSKFWRQVGENGEKISGFALPLLRFGKTAPVWKTCPWKGPWKEMIPLLPGPSPLGLRLPLDKLECAEEELLEEWRAPDDTAPFPPRAEKREVGRSVSLCPPAPENSIRLALCVQPARDSMRVFLPPVGAAASFIDLLGCLERTAKALDVPVRLEGYPPPFDPRLLQLTITPDPGVVEVNLPPLDSWPALEETAESLYRKASECGLRSWKFLADGRRVGSGGGTHFTLGAKHPAASPWLRRPDLLRSFLTYWHNHPGLSHGFSGLFVGPTSQAPRLDQSRPYVLQDAELALRRLRFGNRLAPQEVDALLRHFLTDLTGNAHRAEFCIDKLFPENHVARRWGLVEWRGAEMLPSSRHWLVLALLIRTLTVRFWRDPYEERLVPWMETLYDRFALPYFIEADLNRVVDDLQKSDLPFERRWLKPHLDFRFPVIGRMNGPKAVLEIRQALEPWPVLGQSIAGEAPARPVDCSCERLQVLLKSREPDRFRVVCNGLSLPLAETDERELRVLGLRFKAVNLREALHPHLTPHPPLTFALLDRCGNAVVARGRYHWNQPDGHPYRDMPKTTLEGRRRWLERFRVLPPEEEPPLSFRPPTEDATRQKYTLDLLGGTG